jgi:uncharacterized protein YhjY with autotransporter beta-barrel domain
MKPPCADKQITEAEIIQALQRSDEQALEGLTIREHVAMLDVGTRVDRVYTNGMLVKVQVESGYNMGRYCWVPGAALR